MDQHIVAYAYVHLHLAGLTGMAAKNTFSPIWHTCRARTWKGSCTATMQQTLFLHEAFPT